MAATEYQRTDDLEIKVGTGRYRSFRTGEFATGREAIERAHKLIDSGALV